MRNISFIYFLSLLEELDYNIVDINDIYYNNKPLSHYSSPNEDEIIQNIINSKKLNFIEFDYLIKNYNDIDLSSYKNHYFKGYPIIYHYNYDDQLTRELIDEGINVGCPVISENSIKLPHVKRLQNKLDKTCLFEILLKNKNRREHFINAIHKKNVIIFDDSNNKFVESIDFIKDLLKEKRFRKLFAFMYMNRESNPNHDIDFLYNLGIKATDKNKKDNDEVLQKDLLDIEDKVKQAIKLGYIHKLHSMLPEIKREYPYAGYLIEFFLDDSLIKSNNLDLNLDISSKITSFLY